MLHKAQTNTQTRRHAEDTDDKDDKDDDTDDTNTDTDTDTVTGTGTGTNDTGTASTSLQCYYCSSHVYSTVHYGDLTCRCRCRCRDCYSCPYCNRTAHVIIVHTVLTVMLLMTRARYSMSTSLQKLVIIFHQIGQDPCVLWCSHVIVCAVYLYCTIVLSCACQVFQHYVKYSRLSFFHLHSDSTLVVGTACLRLLSCMTHRRYQISPTRLHHRFRIPPSPAPALHMLYFTIMYEYCTEHPPATLPRNKTPTHALHPPRHKLSILLSTHIQPNHNYCTTLHLSTVDPRLIMPGHDQLALYASQARNIRLRLPRLFNHHTPSLAC